MRRYLKPVVRSTAAVALSTGSAASEDRHRLVWDVQTSRTDASMVDDALTRFEYANHRSTAVSGQVASPHCEWPSTLLLPKS
jgi:hypothetical protein